MYNCDRFIDSQRNLIEPEDRLMREAGGADPAETALHQA